MSTLRRLVRLGPKAGTPLSDLNMTPLIDVLLVLLVVFIIAIPIASHELPIDLPKGTPVTRDIGIENTIGVTAEGGLQWNGEPVSDAELNQLLLRSAKLAPEPTTLFEPDANAAYARTTDVLQLVKQARLTHFAFVGNERYRSFAAN